MDKYQANYFYWIIATILLVLTGFEVNGQVYFENTKLDKVYIEVLEPAASPLPSHLQNLSLVRLNENKTRYDINVIVDNEIKDEYQEYSDEVIDNLYYSAQEILLMSTLYPVNENILSLPGQGTSYIDWQSLYSYMVDDSLDAFVALKSFNIDLTYSCKAKYNYFYGFDEYISKMEVSFKSDWVIFDLHQQKLINRTIRFSDEVAGSTRYTFAEAIESLPEVLDVLDGVSYDGGIEIVKNIIPTWKEEKRHYYSNPRKELREAGNYIASGNWSDAIEIWEKLTDSPRRSVAKHASFNMILADEILGDIEGALLRAKNFYRQFNTKESFSYCKILEERLINIEKLENHFNAQ